MFGDTPFKCRIISVSGQVTSRGSPAIAVPQARMSGRAAVAKDHKMCTGLLGEPVPQKMEGTEETIAGRGRSTDGAAPRGEVFDA